MYQRYVTDMIFKHPTMKTALLFFLLLVNASIDGLAQQRKNLFMIYVNHKAGYMDETGKVVIPAQFLSAGEFSNGLAAVRLNGSYGYINEQGQFVIPPQYDYALGFSGGVARVYSNKKSFFIDSTGKKVFEANYKIVNAFRNGRALVTTPTDAQGYIDQTGKLFIDTVYRRTKPFYNGRAIVFGTMQPDDYTQRKIIYGSEITGLIDTLGNVIIPLRKYRSIGDFENGYARAHLFQTPEERASEINSFAVIDSLGNIVLTKKSKDQIMEHPHGGIVRLQVYDGKKSYSDSKVSFEYINLKGETIFKDNNYKEGEDFYDNRSFIKHTNGSYSLIDAKGKIIKELFCDDVLGSGFRKGKAFVKVQGKWGLIDTNANFLIPPTYEGIHENNSVTGDYFFFTESIPGDEHKRVLNGVAGTDGRTWIKAIITNFDGSGFHGGLLKCSVNKKLTYFNQKGEIVWQEATYANKLLPAYNLDCRRYASYGAHSDHVVANEGGFGESGNRQRDIKDASRYPAGALSLQVRTDLKDTFNLAYQGYQVYLVNRTTQQEKLPAQDGGLFMLMEAQDKDGVWRDIEYHPSSWCGNSYHTLILDPGKCWQFKAPVYEGDFKTKLRLSLTLTSRHSSEPVTLYSNTFNGSVNPAQFWRQEEQEYLRALLNHHTLLPKTYYTLY